MGSRNNVSLLDSTTYTANYTRIINNAKEEAVKQVNKNVGTEQLLLAILIERNSTACKMIISMIGRNIENLYSEIISIIGGSNLGQQRNISPFAGGPFRGAPNMMGGQFVQQANPESDTPMLDSFSRDLTALARAEKLDPVIGRDEEIARIMNERYNHVLELLWSKKDLLDYIVLKGQ